MHIHMLILGLIPTILFDINLLWSISFNLKDEREWVGLFLGGTVMYCCIRFKQCYNSYYIEISTLLERKLCIFFRFLIQITFIINHYAFTIEFDSKFNLIIKFDNINLLWSIFFNVKNKWRWPLFGGTACICIYKFLIFIWYVIYNWDKFDL